MAFNEVECPFCGEDEGVTTELDTKPKAYAVVCGACGAQGPTGESWEQANQEWEERSPLTVDVEGYAAAVVSFVRERPELAEMVRTAARLVLDALTPPVLRGRRG